MASWQIARGLVLWIRFWRNRSYARFSTRRICSWLRYSARRVAASIDSLAGGHDLAAAHACSKYVAPGPGEKGAGGAFSYIGPVYAGKKPGFCRLRNVTIATSQVRQAAAIAF